MATLQVTNLQNIASGVINLSLLADGTTSLVLNAAGTSRTGGLRYNGGALEVFNGTVWVAAGGGGGGTVTGVTASLPLVSTGGTAPVLSINAATNATAGSMSAADKAKLDGAATIVSAVTGTLPITVATGTSTPVIAINAATAAAAGSIEIATLAEAAAGTDATRASTPETAVPKDASGMTGAALLPSGTNAQRVAIATPVAGMTRFNTDTGNEEVYTGATLGWQNLAYAVAPTTLTDVTIPTGATTLSPSYYCKNFTVTAGATLSCTGQGVYIRATGDVVINASAWTAVGVLGPSSVVSPGIVLGVSGSGLGAGQAGFNVDSRPYYVLAQLGGSSGASGTSTSGGSGNQKGGNAGGYIFIVADGNITLNGAVTMNCSGSAGGGSGNGGGGGGGSGGDIILASQKTITSPATVTFNVSGGAGSNGIFSANPAGGGGGGGGGWIILQSANLVDSSTKNLAGGAGGTSTGASATGGGGGGANAGSGGGGSNSAASGTAGSAGVFTTGYVPV